MIHILNSPQGYIVATLSLRSQTSDSLVTVLGDIKYATCLLLAIHTFLVDYITSLYSYRVIMTNYSKLEHSYV